MKYLRTNWSLVLVAVLILALIGMMLSQMTHQTVSSLGAQTGEAGFLRIATATGTQSTSLTASPPSSTPIYSPAPTFLPSFCIKLIHTMLVIFPQNGLQFSSVEKSGQYGRVVSLQGVITGETQTIGNVDLARMIYPVSGTLRSLWFATGFVDPTGAYFPMNVLDLRGNRAWGTRAQAEEFFQQAGKGVFLTLTGFVRRDEEIAWENCSRWTALNPQGICSLGLELEFASHGGSMQFLQSNVAPEGWFAFGWAVYLDTDVPLPKDVGVCIP